MEPCQVAANCTDNAFDLCQFKRAVFGLQGKIMYYYDKYFYCKTARSSSFYQFFSLPLFFFTEGYNLLLLSSWWNSALLYSVGACLPLWTLALAQMFAGTIGLNLVLLTYCNYMGSSHWMQDIFLKYNKTFLPGVFSWENIPIVWKEVISLREALEKCPGTQSKLPPLLYP